MGVAIETYQGSQGAGCQQASSLLAIGCSRSQQKQRLLHCVLTFKRAELIYDVENNCYVEGHIIDENREHGRHMVKDVGQEGNVDRVTRVLDLCHRIASERLYQWSRHDLHVAEEAVPWRDELQERDEYRIDLIVPDTVSQTTINLIEQMVHEYMVCSAVADWLSITKPEKSEVWMAKAQSALQSIGEAQNHRSSKVLTRPLQPF